MYYQFHFYQKLTSQTVPVYVTSSKNGEIEKILYKDPGNDNKVSVPSLKCYVCII